MNKDLRELEKVIGYHFNDRDFIEEALAHPSLKQHDQHHKNYERMELLGDSLLGFLVSEMLFREYKSDSAGNLAKLKSYLVSKEVLCLVAAKLQLADYMVMTKGEEASGGRTNLNNIENTLEALIAAIYLDSDIARAKDFVITWWHEFATTINVELLDPKTNLQEWSQEHGFGIPKYALINKVGPVHSPTFTIRVTVGNYSIDAIGSPLKNAEKLAARKLLAQLRAL